MGRWAGPSRCPGHEACRPLLSSVMSSNKASGQCHSSGREGKGRWQEPEPPSGIPDLQPENQEQLWLPAKDCCLWGPCSKLPSQFSSSFLSVVGESIRTCDGENRPSWLHIQHTSTGRVGKKCLSSALWNTWKYKKPEDMNSKFFTSFLPLKVNLPLLKKKFATSYVILLFF